MRLRDLFSSPALTVFLALVLVQGFHEVEHVVQVVQRSALGIPDGNGLIGSFTDIEPLHFIYNAVYLGLLGAVFVFLGLHRDGPSAHGSVIAGALTFALALQMWHVLEHTVKLAQYVALGVNGTGGILGRGPGALLPVFPIPLLHLAYNTVAYLPALVAFVLMVRSARSPSGHRASARRVAAIASGSGRASA